VSDYAIQSIAGSLLALRKSFDFSLSGKWSVCVFDLGDPEKTEAEIVQAWGETMIGFYSGDIEDVISIELPEQDKAVIYFLVPYDRRLDCGRCIHSFDN